MDLAAWAILLLFVGLLLIVSEIFVPSGGLIGIAAAACCLVSIACGWGAWGSRPLYFMAFVAGECLLIPIVSMIALMIWPRTPMGRDAILAGPKPEDVIPFQDEEKRLRKLIGRVGETVTVLNPAGMVRLENERLHCQSEGMILEAGTPVRVVAVQGNRVIVRKHLPSAAAPEADPEPQASSLDFDLG